MSEHDIHRLQWAIDDLIEAEPIEVITAAARATNCSPIAGLVITDFNAEAPGEGTGSRILPVIVEMCHEAGLPIYLSPACANSKRFYERHGFERLSKMRFGQMMVNLPPVQLELAA